MDVRRSVVSSDLYRASNLSTVSLLRNFCSKFTRPVYVLGDIQYLCGKKPCIIYINTMSANNENFNKLRADIARLNSTPIATTRMELCMNFAPKSDIFLPN